MTLDKAVKFLESKGFITGKDYFKSDRSTSLFKRMKGSDCQCNHKPPNIQVSLTVWNGNLSIEIGIKAQAINLQWVNFMFYAMEVRELENIATYENLLDKCWESVN